jgi:ABC-type polysaccharide/polyol phosphate transport system ATPase subunit
MQPAIRVDRLGKRYRIDHQAQRYRTLRDSLTDLARAPLRRLREGGNRREDFWALRDVGFEVEQGQIVGIIGRNGAGKSTLLKILSRITRPTSGFVELQGRVGSLLEVGTGFHPELTGRENIFLNGSILGMRRREIERRFDEIVAFAEIERFLDTPVKRYSSGMYVRLAFAVAAHLDTEILLVDEVLAVGDVQFQKKCMGKMEEVATGGRTIVLVSHQMSAIQRLCQQAVLLDRGGLLAYGPKESIVPMYLSLDPGAAGPEEWVDVTGAGRSGSGEVRFLALRYNSHNELAAGRPFPDGPLQVDLVVESDARRRVDRMAVSFCDRYGTRLVNADTIAVGRSPVLRKGRNHVGFYIKNVHLNPGVYTVSLWMAGNGRVIDSLPGALQVEVVDLPTEGRRGIHPEGDGLVTCDFELLAVDEHAAVPAANTPA